MWALNLFSSGLNDLPHPGQLILKWLIQRMHIQQNTRTSLLVSYNSYKKTQLTKLKIGALCTLLLVINILRVTTKGIIISFYKLGLGNEKMGLLSDKQITTI